MASLIYPEFERIIRVSHPDGNNGYDIATEIGDSGNITRWVEHAEFTLAPEFGCCEGRLVMVAFDDDRSTIKLNNPFLLSFGDLVEFIAETGQDPVYAGIVIPPRRNTGDFKHEYRLAGLANQLYGIPPVASGETVYEDVWPSKASPNGLVQELTAAGGVIDSAYVGILRPANFDYTNMTYTAATSINRMTLDVSQNLADVFQDLARLVNDDTESHATYPWPVIWGVDADRVIYFNFRPDTEVMGVNFNFDPRLREGTPVVTVGGVELQNLAGDPMIPQWEWNEGSEFRNVLVVRGGVNEAGGGLVEERYIHAASVNYYKSYKQDIQEMPEFGTTFDAARFASGYFQRYAYARRHFILRNVVFTHASGFVKPWLGYANVTMPDMTGEASKLDIDSVRVTWDETPVADIEIGAGEISAFSGVGGSPRWPGNAMKKVSDRIPRVARAETAEPETPGSTDPYWIYAVGFGSAI